MLKRAELPLQNKWRKMIQIGLVLIAVCLNIKYIFTDFGLDGGFQTSMSYRWITGDRLFKEMWEPYQMSTFVCGLFEKIYLSLFHTTTGIVLFLQAAGVLLDAAVAVCVYKVVSKYIASKETAFYMAWLLMLVSPKDIPIAEYSNMQIWFSMFLVLGLYLYHHTGKKLWIVGASVALCGAALSYPSCVIVLAGAVGLLLYKKDWKAIWTMILVCGCCAAAYMGMVLSQVSVSEMLETIHHMLQLETSHGQSVFEKFFEYFKDAVSIGLLCLLAYGIAYALVLLTCRNTYKSWSKTKLRVQTDKIFFAIITLVAVYRVLCWQENVRYSYSLVFVGIMILGARHCRVLSKDKFYFYLCGTVIALLQFVATLLLTNLVLWASIPYLLVAVVTAILPISEAMFSEENEFEKERFLPLIPVLLAMFLVFRNGYLIRPLNGDVSTIFNIANMVKGGPAKGIVSEYMGPYMQNETLKEWEAYIEDGDSVYLIGWSLDSLAYLYSDVEIGSPSLVPTPGYGESLLRYWELYPEKYPDVIVASCWYGEMNFDLTEDSWIMKWIEEEYQPSRIVDGKYWRYYFKE